MTAALRVLNPSRSELVGEATLQRDAATPRGWVEAGAHAAVAAVQHAAEQVEVHAAHHVGVLPGQGMKRTVRQRYDVIVGSRFVTVIGEHASDGAAAGGRAAPTPQPGVDAIAQLAAFDDGG